MFRRVRQIAIALAAIVTMASPAFAVTIIDFRNGTAPAGGSITWDGTNVYGTDLPIGVVEVFGAPSNNGVYDVDGALSGPVAGLSDGNYGDLDFNTATGLVTLSGCIAGLGAGPGVGFTAGGTCTNPVLASGTISSYSVSDSTGGSRVDFNGFDFKHPDLVTAIGLNPLTPWFMDTFALLTGTLTPNGAPVSSVSTDFRNAAVPEPATMVLLGTGLLAAFRARRRTA